MTRLSEAGVKRHADVLAQTWESFLQEYFGEEFCQQVGLENPFSVTVSPSKRMAIHVTEQEFKVDFPYDDAQKIGLHSMLQGYCQFSMYSFARNGEERLRVRVVGCEGIINLYRIFTLEEFRSNFPQWAESFEWPAGNYAVMA